LYRAAADGADNARSKRAALEQHGVRRSDAGDRCGRHQGGRGDDAVQSVPVWSSRVYGFHC